MSVYTKSHKKSWGRERKRSGSLHMRGGADLDISML